MAGPGKPGPPSRKDDERLEQAIREREVVFLREAGYTYDEIAERTGYAHRRSIQNIMMRWGHQTLTENDVLTQRSLKFMMLERLAHKIEPHVSIDPSLPPDPKMVDALLKVIKAQRDLMGLDVPSKIEFNIAPESGEVGDDVAADYQRFAELADLIGGTGYGSGRVIDATEVEDDEDENAEHDSVGRVTSGIGTDALGRPELEVGSDDEVEDIGFMPSTDQEAFADDEFMPNMSASGDDDDEAIGQWIDGRFVLFANTGAQ
jgi:hypothetical protein